MTPLTWDDGEAQTTLWPTGEKDAPLVMVLAARDGAQPVVDALAETHLPCFLAWIVPRRWNDQLTPWSAPSPFQGSEDFGGHGREFLDHLEGPWLQALEARLARPWSQRFLAGYSLGGLFALWAAFSIDGFDGVASCSGSLWYPDLLPWLQSRPVPRRLRSVYLSLGKKEARTRNRYLRHGLEALDEVAALCAAASIPCEKVLEAGNHFQDVDGRVTRALTWLLR